MDRFDIVAGAFVCAVFFVAILGFAFAENYLNYYFAKSNCDVSGGNLTYEGQQQSWLFTIDTWTCKSSTSYISTVISKSQTCFQNGNPINCSEMGYEP